MALSPDTIRAASWEAEKTITRFYRLLDGLNYDAVAKMFTDDGIWFRKNKELRTPEERLSALTDSPLRTPTLISHHLLRSLTYHVKSAEEVDFTGYVVSLMGDNGLRDGMTQRPRGNQSIHLCSGTARATPDGWKLAYYTPGPARLLAML